MSTDILQNVSLYAYLAGGILFVISVVLFFLFDIPKLFNEITGRASRKFIADTNKKNQIMVSEQENQSVYGISEQLISTELPNKEYHETTPRIMTTKLSSQHEMRHSVENTIHMQKNAETELPVRNSDIVFSVIQEFSFTSSTEIIE